MAKVKAATASDPATVFSRYHCGFQAGARREQNFPTTAPAGSAKNTGASTSDAPTEAADPLARLRKVHALVCEKQSSTTKNNKKKSMKDNSRQ